MVPQKLLILAILVIAGLLFIRRCTGSRENMVPITREITEKRGFLPSHQGPWFQNLPPSTKMENDYHALMAEECNGNYADLECRQKSYIKTVKSGTNDIKDLMCWRFHPDQGGTEELYYKCMDGAYGNYIWMNRFTGTDPCLCPNGEFPNQGQGSYDENGNCYCPEKRPMSQRWALDQYGNVVSRITQGNYL